MKQFRAAVIVLTVIILLVLLNAIGIRHVTADLIASLDALPAVPDPERTPTEVAALREHLDRHTTFISLSVNYTVLDRALEALLGLEAYARAGDTAQYEATRATLRDLLCDLERLERLHIENLL